MHSSLRPCSSQLAMEQHLCQASRALRRAAAPTRLRSAPSRCCRTAAVSALVGVLLVAGSEAFVVPGLPARVPGRRTLRLPTMKVGTRPDTAVCVVHAGVTGSQGNRAHSASLGAHTLAAGGGAGARAQPSLSPLVVRNSPQRELANRSILTGLALRAHPTTALGAAGQTGRLLVSILQHNALAWCIRWEVGL